VGGVCLGQTIRLTSAVGYCPVGFKPGSNRLGSNNCSRVISQILGFFTHRFFKFSERQTTTLLQFQCCSSENDDTESWM